MYRSPEVYNIMCNQKLRCNAFKLRDIYLSQRWAFSVFPINYSFSTTLCVFFFISLSIFSSKGDLHGRMVMVKILSEHQWKSKKKTNWFLYGRREKQDSKWERKMSIAWSARPIIFSFSLTCGSKSTSRWYATGRQPKAPTVACSISRSNGET